MSARLSHLKDTKKNYIDAETRNWIPLNIYLPELMSLLSNCIIVRWILPFGLIAPNFFLRWINSIFHGGSSEWFVGGLDVDAMVVLFRFLLIFIRYNFIVKLKFRCCSIEICRINVLIGYIYHCFFFSFYWFSFVNVFVLKLAQYFLWRVICLIWPTMWSLLTQNTH